MSDEYDEDTVLISRGDAVMDIARYIAAEQFVISIPPQIAPAVMDALDPLNPTYYLDKGLDEILVSTDSHHWARGAMEMCVVVFGANRIAVVAVLPIDVPLAKVAKALHHDGPLDDLPPVVLLSPEHDDPEVNYVVDLLLEALRASNPDWAAYLTDAAKAYEEKYGDG